MTKIRRTFPKIFSKVPAISSRFSEIYPEICATRAQTSIEPTCSRWILSSDCNRRLIVASRLSTFIILWSNRSNNIIFVQINYHFTNFYRYLIWKLWRFRLDLLFGDDIYYSIWATSDLLPTKGRNLLREWHQFEICTRQWNRNANEDRTIKIIICNS